MSGAVPLHGLALEAILAYMLELHGWEGLWMRIPANCFKYDPGMKPAWFSCGRLPGRHGGRIFI